MYVHKFQRMLNMLNHSSPPAFRRIASKNRGFTLIELIIVIAILSILMGIMLPDMHRFLKSARIKAQAADLVSDLNRARTEAATRGRRVVVCVSTDKISCADATTSWTSGRITFVDLNTNGKVDKDEPILHYSGPANNDISFTLTTFTGSVAFTPYGGLIPATSGSFKICSSSYDRGRLVSISSAGRATTSATTCL